MSFKRMLEDLEVLMDWEEDEGDEVGNIEEGVSTGAVKMVVETMLEAPRVKSMFKRLGIDLTQAGVSESLYAALEPAVMVFLGEQGTHVAGMSKAKTAMRGMAKGKVEGEEPEGEQLDEGKEESVDVPKEDAEEINDAKLEAALNALYPHK